MTLGGDQALHSRVSRSKLARERLVTAVTEVRILVLDAPVASRSVAGGSARPIWAVSFCPLWGYTYQRGGHVFRKDPRKA
jgi:hypothetical protein